MNSDVISRYCGRLDEWKLTDGTEGKQYVKAKIQFQQQKCLRKRKKSQSNFFLSHFFGRMKKN